MGDTYPNVNNLTDEQVQTWADDVKAQIEKLSGYIDRIKSIISEGGESGDSIIKVTSSDSPELSNMWNNFSLSMDAANQKLTSQKEIFYSSISTFIRIVKEANEKSTAKIEEATVSFEDAQNDLNNV